MVGYTDYCTCFYSPEENKVYFYDEIKDDVIAKQDVSDESEADRVMRIWQYNAPQGIICQMLY